MSPKKSNRRWRWLVAGTMIMLAGWAASAPAQAVRQQLVDPQKPADQGAKPGKKAPVTITAVGNRLIITSDDPEALDLVQDLVRLLTQSPSGEKSPFEIIRLKNASATEAAKVLDQAYNGTKTQNQQQGFPFFNPFGPRPATTPAKDRIRVVADPGSNSLLVQASPLDMLEIRRLLEKSIDSGETDSSAVMRTWILPPLKYASATEVVEVVRNVYRESMNNNANLTAGGPPGGGFGRFGGFARFRAMSQNVDANGEPRGVTL